MKILDFRAQDPLDVRHNAHANSDHYLVNRQQKLLVKGVFFSAEYCFILMFTNGDIQLA